MTRDLLWRGMLAGILAALLATLFARAFAEPQVDLAIAFEASHSAPAAHHADHAMAMPAADEEPELVSRETQKGLGLATALLLYGAAVGGLFALVFAYGYGRIARIGPRSFALLLGTLAFVAIALIPALKYPATPPAVGQHETVGLRTLVYFGMIGASLVALISAARIRTALLQRFDAMDAMLGAAAAYVLLVALVAWALPMINEVPQDFPAVLLWKFRVASLGTQLVLWTSLSAGFGYMVQRRLTQGGR